MIQDLKIGDVVFSLTKGQGAVKNQCQALEIEFEGETKLYKENSKEMKELSYTPWFNETGGMTATFRRKENSPKEVNFKEGDIVYFQIQGNWQISRFIKTNNDNTLTVNIAKELYKVEEFTLTKEHTPLNYFPLTGAKPINPKEAPKRWGYFDLGQIVFNGEEWGEIKRYKGHRELEVEFNGKTQIYTLEGCLPEDETKRVLSYTEDTTLESAYPKDIIDYTKFPLGTPVLIKERSNDDSITTYLGMCSGGGIPEIHGTWNTKIEVPIAVYLKHIKLNDSRSWVRLKQVELYYPIEEPTIIKAGRSKRKRRGRY